MKPNLITCPKCKGKREIKNTIFNGYGSFYEVWQKCNQCFGKGKVLTRGGR